MSFHNVRLPPDIERGAEGGPGFNTTVLGLSSGFEKRNINWSRSRGRWDISYGLRSKTDADAVLAFFMARQGRAYGFRFKDWTDYQIGSSGSPQTIATADGTQTKFQAVRRYSSGGVDFDREITRLVSGTVTVYVNGSPTGSVTVDVDTGIITFSGAPSASDTIGLVAEFDVPVRFDADRLDLRAFWNGDYSLPAIDIVELRETLGSLS